MRVVRPRRRLSYETAASRTSADQGRATSPGRPGRRIGHQAHREAADQGRETMRTLRRVQLGDGGAWAGDAPVQGHELRQANPPPLNPAPPPPPPHPPSPLTPPTPP